MRPLRWTVVGCLVIGLAGCGPTSTTSKPSPTTTKPEPKKELSNKEKILGTWEPVKPKAGEPDSIAFLPDGKMKVMAKDDKGKPVTVEGTYTVDGDKITSAPHGPDGKPLKGPDGKEMKETATITKLTDTELVTKDEKGKTDEFKKKK